MTATNDLISERWHCATPISGEIGYDAMNHVGERPAADRTQDIGTQRP